MISVAGRSTTAVGGLGCVGCWYELGACVTVPNYAGYTTLTTRRHQQGSAGDAGLPKRNAVQRQAQCTTVSRAFGQQRRSQPSVGKHTRAATLVPRTSAQWEFQATGSMLLRHTATSWSTEARLARVHILTLSAVRHFPYFRADAVATTRRRGAAPWYNSCIGHGNSRGQSPELLGLEKAVGILSAASSVETPRSVFLHHWRWRDS